MPDDVAVPSPLPPDQAAHELLLRAYPAGAASVFETLPDDALPAAKAGADLLVSTRLARYADDGRTEIALTPAGRYWAMTGGWLAFLRDPDATRPGGGGGGGRERNPELEQLRLSLTKLRLSTFWWSFGLSVAGFVISIVSLVVALTIGDRLLGR